MRHVIIGFMTVYANNTFSNEYRMYLHTEANLPKFKLNYLDNFRRPLH